MRDGARPRIRRSDAPGHRCGAINPRLGAPSWTPWSAAGSLLRVAAGTVVTTRAVQLSMPTEIAHFRGVE